MGSCRLVRDSIVNILSFFTYSALVTIDKIFVNSTLRMHFSVALALRHLATMMRIVMREVLVLRVSVVPDI